MGKKKKESQTTSNNSSTLQYKGNVKLSIKQNGIVTKEYKINNTGTSLLFQQLALGLIQFPNFLTPNFIAVGSNSTGNTLTLNALVDEIPNSRTPLTNKKVSAVYDKSEVIGYKAEFTGAQYYSTIGSVNISEIGLYGDISSNTLLARITLQDTIHLDLGQNLIIEWSMSIQNNLIDKE